MTNLHADIITLIKGIQYKGRIPVDLHDPDGLIKAISESFPSVSVNDELVKDIIIEKVFQEQLENAREKRKLAIVFTQSQLDSVAKKIERQLEAFPEKYEFIIKMPVSEKEFDEALGPRIRMYTVKEDTPKGSKAPGDTGLLEALMNGTSLIPRVYSKGEVILKIGARGIITQYDHIKLDEVDPLYLYKTIMTLLDVQSVFDIKPPNIEVQTTLFTFKYAAYRKNDTSIVREFEGDHGDVSFANRRVFNSPLIEIGNFDERCSIVKHVLTNVKSDAGENVKQLQFRIRNAAYWHYEALKAKNTHTRIMHTVTTIDALLGTQNDPKEFKAEVIAQAITSDYQSEELVKKTIIELYELRNSIVHGSIEINTLDDFSLTQPAGSTSRSVLFKGQDIARKYLMNRLRRFISEVSPGAIR